MKSSYTIHEARARLSELVRAAKRGRELVITEHGRPVARLIGIGELGVADRMTRLQAQGVLTAFPEQADVELEPITRKRGATKRFLDDR